MWRLAVLWTTAVLAHLGPTLGGEIDTGDKLVETVVSNCVDMGCVKENVLNYLDNVVDSQEQTARKTKNIDSAIFKRVARLFKTHEFRVTLPEAIFEKTELVYNPKTGLDVASTASEGRGLLKKKLLLPVLLLLKLKMKMLMPIFVALIGLKSLKALILSKLAILIVLGFVAYQLLGKGGMMMPMTMMPATPEPPNPVYGAPAPAPSTPSSYEPGWEPNQGGPYARIWSPSAGDSQSLAYPAYYPGLSSTSSRP